MTLGERLQEEREKKGLTREKLASMTDVIANTIYRIEKGISNPSAEVIAKIAKILDVSTDYLLGLHDISDNEKIPISNIIIDMSTIPVLGKISAGNGINIPQDQEIIDYISIPKTKKANFALIVQGNSMEPKFNEGDLAIIYKTDVIENGEIGVICVNGDDAVIKKFYQSDNEIQLISLNTDYPAKIFRGSEMKKIRIIGKVIGRVSFDI